jgi:ferredoxin
MKPLSANQGHIRTTFVRLDTSKCVACWNCLEECKNHIIGRINLPWHKHARFVNDKSCTGCVKCISVCEHGALSKISVNNPGNSTKDKKLVFSIIINSGLLLLGLVMIYSGFLIQLKYHIGHHLITDGSSIAGVADYKRWSGIHKISVVIFSVLVFVHTLLHWNWYKTVFKKKSIYGSKQLIFLSVISILTALTGFTPWFIQKCHGQETLRRLFIELHDKIAILLFIFLILHVAKRLKWYFNAINRINKGSGIR